MCCLCLEFPSDLCAHCLPRLVLEMSIFFCHASHCAGMAIPSTRCLVRRMVMQMETKSDHSIFVAVTAIPCFVWLDSVMLSDLPLHHVQQLEETMIHIGERGEAERHRQGSMGLPSCAEGTPRARALSCAGARRNTMREREALETF